MAVCRHQLGGTMDLEEWYALMNKEGRCRECNAVMNREQNLQFQLRAAQKELTALHEHKFGLYATIEGLEEERDRWAEAATIQNGEIESCLIELEKAGWNGPASPGVEHLRERAELAEQRVNELERRSIKEQLRTGVAEDAIRRLCQAHNVRGSDGPCDCSGCRLVNKLTQL